MNKEHLSVDRNRILTAVAGAVVTAGLLTGCGEGEPSNTSSCDNLAAASVGESISILEPNKPTSVVSAPEVEISSLQIDLGNGRAKIPLPEGEWNIEVVQYDQAHPQGVVATREGVTIRVGVDEAAQSLRSTFSEAPAGNKTSDTYITVDGEPARHVTFENAESSSVSELIHVEEGPYFNQGPLDFMVQITGQELPNEQLEEILEGIDLVNNAPTSSVPSGY